MTLLALVIGYKQHIDDIPSVKTLLAARGASTIHLQIWDNSPQSYIEENARRAGGLKPFFASVSYAGIGVNRALSHIYNEVLDNWLGQARADLAIILDQDSELAEDFLEHATRELQQVPAHLLRVPQVVAAKSGVLVSPRRQQPYYLFKRYVFSPDFQGSAPGVYPARDLFAVASGLMISKQLWNSGIRFEEKLHFYGVDTEFCSDYARRNETFLLSSAAIRHDISDENVESWDVKMWRFGQHMDYWRIQLEKHAPYPAFLTNLYVSAYRAAFQLKHRLKRVLNGFR